MALTPTRYLQAFSIIQSQTRQSIEGNQVVAIMKLYNAGDDGLSIGEFGDAASISHVSASRMVRVFGPHGMKDNKEGGWGIVDIYYDHTRPRATMVKLNKKGRKLVDDFLSLLND